MRIVLLAALVCVAGCGVPQHGAAPPACRLSVGTAPSPETGEHAVVAVSSCVIGPAPRVELLGAQGRALAFTYVEEGGARGGHAVLLDKYRCDIRSSDAARTLVLNGARLELGRSLLDWCPAEAVSSVVHVYLSTRQLRPTWRGVLRDIYDGRLDRVWPCGALRAAIAHLPGSRVYSTVPQQLAPAAAQACDAALGAIPPGAPRFAVVEALGAPDRDARRCPVWRWQPESGSVDGARICFAHGRATLVQTAVHG